MLTSPIDGVVVRRDAVLGRFLQPDEKAFAVADPSRLWATVEVYEYDLPYFHVGSEVEISIDAMPGVVVKGKVAVIEPQIGSASRAVRARIAVDNSQGLLRPGFFVRASVAIPNALGKNRSLVAPGAVQPIGDEDVVFVERSPGLFEVRPVRIARRTPQVIEIAEGLSNGERIAVEGGFLLRGEVTKQ
jgi:RND family efflux transporter MFP subunit